eukprot:scaffold19625_cov114-Skeletonema_dohrnii-CCMP3373.AAC.1
MQVVVCVLRRNSGRKSRQSIVRLLLYPEEETSSDEEEKMTMAMLQRCIRPEVMMYRTMYSHSALYQHGSADSLH